MLHIHLCETCISFYCFVKVVVEDEIVETITEGEMDAEMVILRARMGTDGMTETVTVVDTVGGKKKLKKKSCKLIQL